MDYLPKDATIEEACNWLQAKTGQTWVLARLLECHLTPHFWLDYKPGYPAIYGDKIEGYQTRMIFQGDLCRLESDRGDALVNMFTAHDGTLVKVQPGLRVPLSELKFKRESVERVAEIINKAAQPQAATPAPVAKETPAERRARWLDMFEAEEKLVKRGALQRLAKREGVDRSNMGKDIAKARARPKTGRCVGFATGARRQTQKLITRNLPGLIPRPTMRASRGSYPV